MKLSEKEYTKAYLLEMVYGTKTNKNDPKYEEITNLFKIALGVTDLKDQELVELNEVFEPDIDIQQIRYKRAFGRVLGAKRDFVIIKNQEGQAEHKLEGENQLDFNDKIGFKCLHYSVAEASGTVKVTIVNKEDSARKVGVRTVSDTALENDDFKPINEVVEIPASGSHVVEVEVINDEGWEPDEDFFIELYDQDQEGHPKLYGDNCITKITILDDDKPGVL